MDTFVWGHISEACRFWKRKCISTHIITWLTAWVLQLRSEWTTVWAFKNSVQWLTFGKNRYKSQVMLTGTRACSCLLKVFSLISGSPLIKLPKTLFQTFWFYSDPFCFDGSFFAEPVVEAHGYSLLLSRASWIGNIVAYSSTFCCFANFWWVDVFFRQGLSTSWLTALCPN